MKRKLVITTISLFLYSILLSQNWKQNLPRKEKKELTFFDYQKAFYEYWDNYNVISGKYIDKNGKEVKAEGYKNFKRWEYFWESRIDLKTGKLQKDKYFEELKTYKKQLNANKSRFAWTSLGPSSTGGGYAGIGRVATIAFHPNDNNYFWIGAPAGGLWKTTDGGNNWTPLTENNEVQGVSAIAIPSDFSSSQTIYIGTGDRDAFDNNSIGILKSTDAGLSWQTTGLVFQAKDSEVINAMLISPTDNNNIFAATSNGLYISLDAGNNWTLTSNIEFIDIEFKPNNSNIIYASTRSGKVYKSSDTGNNWTEILNTNGGNRVEIAVSSDAPERLYVLGANSANGLKGIWRSYDSGDNFNLVFSGAILNWSTTGTGENNGQAWYDLAFDANPLDANNLYVGGVNSWKSIDGGDSWTLANHWYGGGGVQDVHADKHFFKFIPNTSILFECNDGGIYKTNNGTNWTHLANGLSISQMYGLSTAQSHPNMTITGLQDNGTKAILGDGNWYDVMGGDGMKSLIDFTNEQIQYGSSQYGNIKRTNNAWASSVWITPPENDNGPWVTQYVLDPNNNNTLYVGRNSLWKSNNKGDSYENIGNYGNLKSIAVAPSNSNIIYIASATIIRKSINSGASWNSITSGLPTGSNVINDIAIKHNDNSVLWVALGEYTADGVYQSTDGGESWTNISSGLPEIPVNTIIQNKFETNETQLFAGTDFGVYIKNGNDDWILYGTNMPKVVVSELDIYYDNNTPSNSRLRAATYGRGLWEIPLELSGNFVPYITSSAASNITENSATAEGEIINNYGFNILESGIVISAEPNPLLGKPGVSVFQTSPTVTGGTFSINLSSLSSGTRYYYKAYAINQNGTGYGNEIIFNTNCSIIQSVPYNQDFENFGMMPLCWSEEILNGSNVHWTFGELPIYFSHAGQYCAYVDNNTIADDKTLLIMPVYDFSAYSNLHISFWHIQAPIFSFQDELKVLYKNDYNDTWNEIAYYSNAVNEWTQKNINLPNLSSTYYIAFEANEKRGKGVGIDDITISEGLVDIQQIETDDIKIYPNPSKEIFNISLSNSQLIKSLISINITDITGKQIKSFTANKLNNKIELKIQSSKKGFYFINLIFENKTYSYKIIMI